MVLTSLNWRELEVGAGDSKALKNSSGKITLVLLGGWFSVKTIQVSLASEGRLEPGPVDYRVSRPLRALWTQRIWVTP